MFKYSFLYLFISIIYNTLSCSGQVEKTNQNVRDTFLNTKIVIHYKSKVAMDTVKQQAKLQKYQSFALENYPIIDVPGARMDEYENSQSWSFYISSPQILNIGFTYIYVANGDSIDIAYEQLGMDKYRAPVEKIKINTPNTFILIHGNGKPGFADPDYRMAQYQMKAKPDIERYFRWKYIDSLSTIYTKNIFANNLKFKKTKQREELIKLTLLQITFNQLVATFKGRLAYFKTIEQAEAIQKLQNIHRSFANTIPDSNKAFQYYVSAQSLFTLAYEKDWENKAFQYDTIRNSLEGYDTLTQQYLLLLTLKNDLYELQNNQANLQKIKNAITDPELQHYADKYLALKLTGKTGAGYLTNEIRSTPIYNTDLKETSFGNVFNHTRQPYLYFDFCGSWCAPCLKEIEAYKKSNRRFDTSQKVRPVWLFFENNKETWLKVIDKYHLSKENCFLVMDKKLQELFNQQFEWLGEFPHHFLFSKENKIINKNAPNLLELDEKMIQSKPPEVIPSPM